jgi:hypothetical protein
MLHTDKWLDCDLQRTDPASRQRGHPTDRTTYSRHKLLKRKQYLVKCRQSGLDTKAYIHSDWLTVGRKVTLTLGFANSAKRQARPLIREGAQQRQESNHHRVTNFRSWEPEAAQHQDTLTDLSSVLTWLLLWLWGLFCNTIKPIPL